THTENGNGLFDEEHSSKETKLLEAMDSSRKLFGFKITEYGNENFLHKSFVLTDKKISGV
ncbi:MAG: hypothetical protein ACP5GW_05895, partial [Caldisericaceae bacterium]